MLAINQINIILKAILAKIVDAIFIKIWALKTDDKKKLKFIAISD